MTVNPNVIFEMYPVLEEKYNAVVRWAVPTGPWGSQTGIEAYAFIDINYISQLKDLAKDLGYGLHYDGDPYNTLTICDFQDD